MFSRERRQMKEIGILRTGNLALVIQKANRSKVIFIDAILKNTHKKYIKCFHDVLGREGWTDKQSF